MSQSNWYGMTQPIMALAVVGGVLALLRGEILVAWVFGWVATLIARFWVDVQSASLGRRRPSWLSVLDPVGSPGNPDRVSQGGEVTLRVAIFFAPLVFIFWPLLLYCHLALLRMVARGMNQTDLVRAPRHAGRPCPHCRRPLRTNNSKQCFSCGADWHPRIDPTTSHQP